MTSFIYHGLALAGGGLSTRFAVDKPEKRDYYINATVAVLFWMLAKLVYHRFIYIFYMSPLLHLPLIKVSWMQYYSYEKHNNRGK